MAKLVYGLSQSLDGYVDHMKLGPPGAGVFRHFMEWMRSQSAVLYGRTTYEIMTYWDEDQPDWDADDHEFAKAWRLVPKWVVSHSDKPVGPNAKLIEGDLDTAIRALKARFPGEISIAGPNLAKSLTDLGLIDEYRLYFRPLVFGTGAPFFAGPRPPLRFVSSEFIGEDMLQLIYVPA
jgi:dihydrofolate reductase